MGKKNIFIVIIAILIVLGLNFRNFTQKQNKEQRRQQEELVVQNNIKQFMEKNRAIMLEDILPEDMNYIKDLQLFFKDNKGKNIIIDGYIENIYYKDDKCYIYLDSVLSGFISSHSNIPIILECEEIIADQVASIQDSFASIYACVQFESSEPYLFTEDSYDQDADYIYEEIYSGLIIKGKLLDILSNE